MAFGMSISVEHAWALWVDLREACEDAEAQRYQRVYFVTVWRGIQSHLHLLTHSPSLPFGYRCLG